MKFNELIKQRESCRSYSTKPVETEKLTALIESAILAPSACNSQPWHFVVVNDKEKASKMPSILQGSGINKFTDSVQAFIVVCETKAKLMAGATCDSQHYAQMDIGLTVAHLVLKATEIGLSTCIMGAFAEEPLKEFLSIPSEVKTRLVIAVGYAKEEKIREKKRKDFNDVCSFNQW